MSVSRSDPTPPFLRAIGPEQGTAGYPPEPHPGLQQGDRAGVGPRAPADLDLAPAGLAADGEQGALGEDFDPAGAVFGLVRATIQPDDLRAAQAAGEADRQDRPVTQAPQVHVQRRQHRQQLVGEDRGLLQGRAAVPAADAGEHRGDMAVADVERLAELPVAPGDAGQPPLEGGDRKLGAAALDLRREIEADRFRIGRRLREALAAQPGGEHFPVGGVGALGVVGLRRAGVGLGGLRQRRQPAAEAAAGRSRAGQGRPSGPAHFPTPLRPRSVFRSVLGAVPGALRAEFPGFSHCVRAPFDLCPIIQSYRHRPDSRQAVGFFAIQRDKAPHETYHAPVICADFDLFAEPPADLQERLPAPPATACASQDKPGETPGTATSVRR